MANTIEVIIKQTGSGNAIADTQKALGGLGSAAGGAIGAIGGFGNALGNMATIAGGIVAANIFGRIVDGISGFVTTGLDAVGSSQQLETSLKSLLTANNMYEQSTETVTTAITKQLMTQDELGNKTAELTAKLATQQATYQEQQERIRQLTDEYGDNGLVVIKTKAQHDQLALSIQATEREIANLSTTETKYSTTQKTVWQQTMDQADAYKLAQRETRDLLTFVSELAVVSPFETETVEQTTKYAVAAGLGLKQTKEFVPAFLDLAASVGITSDELGFAADQLFQVKKVGKLTEIDLRQLRRLGIDLGKVIGVEMGMSVEEFNKQAEKSPEIFDELFDAVTRFSQNTFAGTSKEMALSVKGLQSTLNDVFVIGARTFIRPFVDAFTPAIAGIVGKLSDFVLGGDLASMGQQMATTIMSGFERFQKFGAGGLAAMLGFEGGALFFKELSSLMQLITGDATTLGSVIQDVLGEAFTWLTTNLFPILTDGVQFLIAHFNEFKGALMGIGMVVAGGIFASLIAGILALLTPVNLLIAGAALLGAAWAGNWGGIQDKVFAAWAVIQPILDSLMQRADLVIFTFERFGAAAGFSMLGKQIVSVINQIIPGFSDLVTWLQTNIPIAIQAMSDIWNNNLLPGFQRAWQAIQDNLLPLFAQLFDQIGGQGPGFVQLLSDAWNNILLPALAAVGDFLLNTLFPMWVDLQVWLAESIPSAIQTVSDFWTGTLVPAFMAVQTFITGSFLPALQNIWTLFSVTLPTAIQFVVDYWIGIFMPAVTAVWTFISGSLIPLFASLGNLLNAVVGIAITALAGLLQNILLPALTIVSNYITSQIMVRLNLLSVLISTVVGVAVTSFANLWKNTLLPALTAVGNIIKGLVTPSIESVGEKAAVIGPILDILANVVLANVKAGFDNIASAIKSATRFFDDLAGKVRNFKLPAVLTPGSPPPMALALQDVAKAASQAAGSMGSFNRAVNIPTNVLDRLLGKSGLTGFAGFSDILGKAADPMEKFLKDRLGGAKGKFALDAFKKALRAHWTEVVDADGNLSKSAAEQVMKNAVSNWEKAGIKLDFGLAAQVFAENFNDALREQKLLDLEELGKGLGIAGQFASFGQAAAQRLQDRIDILGQLVEAGGGLFEGQTLDALQAQELLNAALEDQASVQAQILDLQRQQADLQFLQQQLDLIKLIQEQGLNVEDILGGITLGLNASLPDIIAAMNAVVEAMIGQLDTSLGIASPSRVMMEKFQQVGAGAVQGLLSTIPAIRDTVIDLASQARNTVTRSTNYYFNQTVNTQASASTVISDFGVMKSLVGV